MKITRVYVRRYSDNGETVACCDWSDGSRTQARPSMHADWRQDKPLTFDFGARMHALFARARREGLRLQRETW